MKYLGVLLTFAILVTPGLSTGGGGLAAADKQAKPPSAAKRFREVYKNFIRAKSYAVSAAIEGGISGAEDHKIKQVTVRERYSGEVFGKYMHVPAGTSHPQAFRTAKGSKTTGAIHTSVGWQGILADQRGVRLDRLFSFPEKLFARAAKYSRSAEWLPVPAGSAAVRSGEVDIGIDLDDIEKELEGEKDGKADKKDEKGSRGRTFVKEKADDEVDESQYRLLRIETPTKEALTHFIEVENSGCMSAG